MSEADDIAEALSQVVELGHSPQEDQLGAAVSRHIADREPASVPPDPAMVAGLRALAEQARGELPDEQPIVSALSVHVDVNELLADKGESETWRILGQLKDLFGGNP
jgi:hypothetical protein